MKKRVVSMLVCLVLALGIFAVPVSAGNITLTEGIFLQTTLTRSDRTLHIRIHTNGYRTVHATIIVDAPVDALQKTGFLIASSDSTQIHSINQQKVTVPLSLSPGWNEFFIEQNTIYVSPPTPPWPLQMWDYISSANFSLSYYAPDSSAAGAVTYITRMYDVFLGRAPDYSGIDHWTWNLSRGLKSCRDVAYSFALGAEYRAKNTSNVQFMTHLYQGLLNRHPDSSGLNYWVNHLNAGVSREEVVTTFTALQEFQTICNGLGLRVF